MNKEYYVYILTNKLKGVLYTGVTSDLVGRVWQHRNEIVEGFSKKYKTKQLIYYEVFNDINEAIHRETCIKRWKREWKIKNIESQNPSWEDLYLKLI